MYELFELALYPLALFTVALVFTFILLVIGAAIESFRVVSKELTIKLHFDINVFIRTIQERLAYPILISIVYAVAYLAVPNIVTL